MQILLAVAYSPLIYLALESKCLPKASCLVVQPLCIHFPPGAVSYHEILLLR